MWKWAHHIFFVTTHDKATTITITAEFSETKIGKVERAFRCHEMFLESVTLIANEKRSGRPSKGRHITIHPE